MVQRKKTSKSKVNASKPGSLDAFISPKKASPSENKLDAPDTGPELITSNLKSLEPSKRKRADNDANPPERIHPENSNTNGTKRRQSKGYAPPSTYSHLPPLTDTLIPNLLCVFVGLNPGIQTATKGHPYAHPSNLYWSLLHTSGLTPDRRLAPSEYVILPETYSLGNTNIVSRATRDGSELSKEEMVEGAGVLDEKIRKWKPEVVCLVGKSIWEAVWKWRHGRVLKKAEFRYGFQDIGENMGRKRKKRSGGFFGGQKEQASAEGDDGEDEEEWAGTRVFVATSTSGLAASLSLREKQEIWAELGEWVQKRREEREQAKEKGETIGCEGDDDPVRSSR